MVSCYKEFEVKFYLINIMKFRKSWMVRGLTWCSRERMNTIFALTHVNGTADQKCAGTAFTTGSRQPTDL